MGREELREDTNKHLAMVGSILEGRGCILGQPSLADFGIYGSRSPPLTVGEGVPSEFPSRAAWVSRMRELGAPAGRGLGGPIRPGRRPVARRTPGGVAC